VLERLLVNNPGLAVVLGVSIFVIEHYLSIYEVYLYHAGAKDFVVYNGVYRLTSEAEAVVQRRRIIGVKFAVTLAILVAGILAAWWISVQQFERPDVFLILMGGLVLVQAAEIIREYRQIMFFREARQHGGLTGRVEYSRRLVLMQWVFDMYGFVILYAVLFLISSSWFILGGALACFVNSRRLRDWTVIKA
jgi:uncharacterized membrane protein (UPF0182 family)